MSLLCRHCGSDDFRLSRLRFSDLGMILVLMYPIRCRACMERRHAPLRLALRFKPSRRNTRTSARAR